MTARSNDRDALEAQIALSRFGLGARPGDLKRIAADPRGAAKAELLARDAALLRDPYLVSTEESARAFIERKTIRAMRNGREIKGTRQVVAERMRAEGRLPPERQDAAPNRSSAKRGADDDDDMAMGAGMDGRDASRRGGNEGGEDKRGRSVAGLPSPPKSPLGDEAAARYVHAQKVGIGFVERLVQFWGNHFTVSSRGGVYVGWIAGAFEREAIRPHVLGRFDDMLQAATRHPAMLIYLDNDTSFGPNSVVGERRNKGLNENHARELLELHTVGVDGGYRQQDVVALAKALTGWRRVRRPDAANHGAFEFDDRAHEPGPQTVMGKVYRQDGLAQGEAILADLAQKPATATHVARRLATAFVADEPPPALVDRLARTFRETDGDLKEVSLALIGSDEAWSAPRAKMRSPMEFVFACVRACGKDADSQMLTKGLKALGQPFWGATSPKGWSLIGRDWIAPDAQTNRLDLAVDIARERADELDPNAFAEDILGAAMSDETRTAVKRAGSREQALALLLMSPEMQRR